MGEMVFEYFFAKGVYLAMEGITESEPFGGKVKTANLNTREQRTVC